jgi:proteasome lid subunit RPN8/RPN11
MTKTTIHSKHQLCASVGDEENPNEEFSLLVGKINSPFWMGELWGYNEGSPASVDFHPTWVYQWEDARDDDDLGIVLGFYHTHPGFAAVPSDRDIRTMRAWVLSLGRPLLCVIRGVDGLRAYWFMDDESQHQERACASISLDYNEYLMGLTTAVAVIKENGA